MAEGSPCRRGFHLVAVYYQEMLAAVATFPGNGLGGANVVTYPARVEDDLMSSEKILRQDFWQKMIFYTIYVINDKNALWKNPQFKSLNFSILYYSTLGKTIYGYLVWYILFFQVHSFKITGFRIRIFFADPDPKPCLIMWAFQTQTW